MQVALGEMEIEGGMFKPLVAHQQLNGAQVGTGFEQMGREAMAQRVGMNLPGQSCALGCYTAGVPDGLIRDGLIDTALACSAGKEVSPRLFPTPITAQLLEQLRGKWYIPVARTLALADVDHHALAVNVLDLDPCCLGSAYSGRIEQHKDHAVQAVRCGIDQPHDLLLAEHDRQLLWHLRENEIVVGEVTPPQRALVQEPQGRDPDLDRAGLKLLLPQQKDLITSQMFGA